MHPELDDLGASCSDGSGGGNARCVDKFLPRRSWRLHLIVEVSQREKVWKVPTGSFGLQAGSQAALQCKPIMSCTLRLGKYAVTSFIEI